jgi:hypothetical protein
MKTTESNSPAQHAWNAVSLIVYAILLVVLGYGLKKSGQDIDQLRTRDIIFIMLATYRLTRIVVFEKIFKFFRDMVKSRPSSKIMNTLRAIITCPWCAGVWIALIIVGLFFLVPYGRLFVFLLAVSGIGTFIILLSNWVSLRIHHEQKDLKDQGSDASEI